MRGKIVAGFVLAVFMAAVFAVVVSAADSQKPEYIGAKKCKLCHAKVKLGGVEYLKWMTVQHRQAYKTLTTDKAKELGAKMGVSNPAKSEKCIKCHVTALKYSTPQIQAKLGSEEARLEEGIGCERCHGPGSLYKTKTIMKDHEASVKAGMRPIKGKTEEERLKNAEKLCRECHGLEHKDESPGVKKFDFKESFEKIKHDPETMKKQFPKEYETAEAAAKK